MIASRRVTWNFALDRAVEWAEKLQKPLVVLEALRCGYPWASDRIHRFVIDGMAENACWFEGTDVLYYPYLEPTPNAGKGLLAALASRACVVVTDEFPCFFLPRMVASGGSASPSPHGSGGLEWPASAAASRASLSNRVCFSPVLAKRASATFDGLSQGQCTLEREAAESKSSSPEVVKRWPKASPRLLNSGDRVLTGISLDHEIHPVDTRGGSTPAQVLLRDFLRNKLGTYADARNQPGQQATSELSPYLHFGHISVHQVFSEITGQQAWSPDHLALRAMGSRTGWWGLSHATEAFLDQVVTWRELGLNFCQTRNDYDQFESLPAWALKTLRLHARDERSYVYTLEKFERAKTHDPLWNAAQTQLVREGRIHNYLRMLWGKKILEWTRSPQKALEIMVELNNKYALDGRDPNSYSGIFWCLGRYDRPWGPERPVFGTVRYMSSENTARKFNIREYVRKYSSSSYEGVTREK